MAASLLQAFSLPWESTTMKITVCQLHHESLAADWDRLVRHVGAQRSELVLLPEMPFFAWFPVAQKFDFRTWSNALAAHDEWERRLSGLDPAIAVGTRPVNYGDVRYSAGFMWKQDEGIIQTLHAKSRLCNEAGAWESGWYDAAVPDFEPAMVGAAVVGMLIGPELWTPGQAQLYGEGGVQIIAVPRADYRGDPAAPGAGDEWLAAGRAAAKAAGAYCISSTRSTRAGAPAGAGWIVSPDGQVLASTSADEPVVTLDIGLAPVRVT